jgi:hypothetical protein
MITKVGAPIILIGILTCVSPIVSAPFSPYLAEQRPHLHTKVGLGGQEKRPCCGRRNSDIFKVSWTVQYESLKRKDYTGLDVCKCLYCQNHGNESRSEDEGDYQPAKFWQSRERGGYWLEVFPRPTSRLPVGEFLPNPEILSSGESMRKRILTRCQCSHLLAPAE